MAEEPGRFRVASLFGWLKQHGFDRRARVAMLMALIATIGAVTAYRSSQEQLSGTSCERKLAEGEIYELVQRQSYLGRQAEYLRWVRRYNVQVGQGNVLLRRANELRASRAAGLGEPDPDSLDIDAQIEFAVARQVKSVSDFMSPNLKGADLETGLLALAQDDLQQLGFRNRCAAAEPNVADNDFLRPLHAEVATIHVRSMNDAAVVALFVLALVCLTLSEVFRAIRRGLEVAGYVVFGVAVLVAVVWADHWLAPVFVATALAFGVVGVAMWIVIRRLHLGEAEKPVARAETAVSAPEPNSGSSATTSAPTHELPELHEFDHEGFLGKQVRFFVVRNAFGATVVLLIATAALLSALSGYGYAVADGHGSAAASEAVSEQLDLLKASTRGATKAYLVIDTLMMAHEARLRTAAARDVALQAQLGDLSSPSQAEWGRQHLIWERAFESIVGGASAADADMRTQLQGESGPYLDPAFPQRLLVASTVERPALALALWDARDEVSATWGDKASLYLATLTMFAIALYLFGQSLGMGHTRGAHVLTFFGIALLLSGIGLGAWGTIRSIPDVDAAESIPAACRGAQHEKMTREYIAAACYARAEVMARLARTAHDWRQVRNAYKEAARLRPGFALAQYLQAHAMTNAATADYESEYISLLPKASLGGIVKEFRDVADTLSRRGLAISASSLSETAWNQYLLALIGNDREKLRDSITMARASVRLDPNSLLTIYNLALLLLADRRDVEALALYERGFRDKHNKGDVPSETGSISDLEVLRSQCSALHWTDAAYCGKLDGEIEELESKFVRAIWPDPKPGRVGIADGSTLAVSLEPDGIGWTALGPSDVAGRPRAVAMLVERLDPEWHAFYVIPRLSHQLDPSEVNPFSARAREFRPTLAAPDFTACVRMEGTYRVDLYSDGRRFSRTIVRPRRTSGAYRGTALRDPGVAMCYPDRARAWKRVSTADGSLTAAYRDPSGRRGADVLAFFAPRRPAPKDRLAHQQKLIERAVNRVLYSLHRAGVESGMFATSQPKCGGYWDDWTVPHVQYVAPTIALFAKAWTTPDGLARVGVAWHVRQPGSDQGEDDESCAILTSMTAIDRSVADAR
jgi:tetratricopeptide (TPR) repeat protein